MKAVPYEARIPNIDRNPQWHTQVCLCDHCGDTGAVVVMLRRYLDEQFIEEYGPCPYCQQGYKQEFDTKAWGPDGYWQGRPTAEVQPLYPTGTQVVKEPSELAKRVLAHLGGTADF